MTRGAMFSTGGGVLLWLLLTSSAGAAPALSTKPSQLVVGQTKVAELTVPALAGSGVPQARVNVGEVLSVSPARGGAWRVRYRLPEGVFPQRLVLLLWRLDKAGKVRPRVHRVPLWAPAVLPITTRPRSLVTLSLGGRHYGPRPSGVSGKLSFRVLVPPEITRGWARVVDDKGLETRKAIEIRRAPYPHLVLALVPKGPRRGGIVSLLVVSSDRKLEPGLRSWGPGSLGGEHIELQRRDGVYSGQLALAKDAPSGRWRLVASLGEERRELSFELPPQAKSRPATRPASRPAAPPRGAWRRLRGILAVAAGFNHNMGELMAPRLALSGGLDITLGPGRLGVDLELAALWDSREDAIGASDRVSTSLVLFPLSLCLRYELSFGPWSPLVFAGPTLLLGRLSQRSGVGGEVRRVESAFGAVAGLGLRWRLGPGGLLLAAGYQHVHFEAPEVELLAGGLFMGVGYRLELGGR